MVSTQLLTHERNVLAKLMNDDELHHRTWRGMKLDRYAEELEAALARLKLLDPSLPRVWIAGKDIASGARQLVDGAPDTAIVRVGDRVFVHSSVIEPLA